VLLRTQFGVAGYNQSFPSLADLTVRAYERCSSTLVLCLLGRFGGPAVIIPYALRPPHNRSQVTARLELVDPAHRHEPRDHEEEEEVEEEEGEEEEEENPNGWQRRHQ